MKSVKELPENYDEYYSVDLQKDKKISLFVNLLALGLGIILIFVGCLFVPLKAFLEKEDELVYLLIKFAIMFVGICLYTILHEFVHGVAMKICGTKKVKYGFTGLYAFAGSDDYYSKGAYIFIALAPVVFWGVVLAIVCCFVSVEWFWVLFIIQVINVSGASGDYFVTIKFLGFPKDILIKDSGVGMVVYKSQQE